MTTPGTPASDPTVTPAPGTPAPAAPPAPPAAPAGAPNEDPPWLAERLQRAQRAILKETGFATPEEAKAAKEALAKVEKDRKEAELAAMTEVERLKTQNAEIEAKRAAAEARASELERKAKVDEILRKKGIGNTDYAHFLIDKERNGATEFDYEASVSRMLGDAKTKSALDITEASSEPPPTVITPTTSPPTIRSRSPPPIPSRRPILPPSPPSPSRPPSRRRRSPRRKSRRKKNPRRRRPRTSPRRRRRLRPRTTADDDQIVAARQSWAA